MAGSDFKKYIDELKKRQKESRAYTPHQLIGLEIAEMLGDRRHKSLYIKLAKERDRHTLLSLAKDVAGRKEVKNKGAYFMKVLYGDRAKQTRKRTLNKREI